MDKTLNVDQLNKRTLELIEVLGLKSHPEGGFYKETYRSVEKVSGEKTLMTSIYFLLTSEHVSHFHRIKSDEHWYFHEGSSLTIHLLNDKGHQELKLGPNLNNGESFYHLVPKNTIFGSTIDHQSGYALVSCAVAPGFDFRDFELLDSEFLRERYPNDEEIIKKLTIK